MHVPCRGHGECEKAGDGAAKQARDGEPPGRFMEEMTILLRALQKAAAWRAGGRVEFSRRLVGGCFREPALPGKRTAGTKKSRTLI